MMKLDIASRLKMKIGCIVVVLLVSVVINQQVLLKDTKQEYAAQLEYITAFLLQELPVDHFLEVVKRRSKAGKTKSDQVQAINEEMQPILTKIVIPDKLIRFGIYSHEHDSIIALGPVLDKAQLAPVVGMNKVETVHLGEKESSAIWYGAQAMYHNRPIVKDGKIVGYVFASVNMSEVQAGIWKKIINVFLYAMVLVLVVIIMFQETIIRLKNNLDVFAEKVVTGQTERFTSVIPELTPVLAYITQQTEAMARLDRLNLTGEMAASIAHEVRNPLTTVRGFLQYLGNKAEFGASKERFALMIEELDRANGIITEFLSLAKNKNMEFLQNNLNDVINEIFPLLQTDAFYRNCQIQTNLAPIPAFSMDKNSMRQLCLNLVRNAIEAMPQGGTINISTKQSAQKIQLFIQDEGVGMPPEVISKLGTPFITTKENGTGLGLAVCYRIVQRHAGTVDVESRPGDGTTFKIAFPV